MTYVGYNGLWGLLVLAGDIWAVINIVQSSASNERKLLWILVVILLPLLGLIRGISWGHGTGKDRFELSGSVCRVARMRLTRPLWITPVRNSVHIGASNPRTWTRR